LTAAKQTPVSPTPPYSLFSQLTTPDNALSISSISASIDVPAQCTLHTVDYTPALVETSPGNWNVGPPQTVEWISCTESGPPPPPPNSITIEFDGADPDVDPNAKYILTVPLNGTPVFTSTFSILS
jgi:hypothetical protein